MITGRSGLSLSSQVTNVEELALSYGSWTGIRTNHVISATGSFFDESGSSRGISTKEDLALLLALRRQADVVIVDAKTARKEKYRKLSSAHLAIVSASGNFQSIPAASSKSEVTLFSPNTPNSDSELKKIEHVAIDPAEPFVALLAWANQMKFSSILLEAGPTLTSVCFATSKVVQSAITVTPRLPKDQLERPLNPFSHEGSLVSLAESEDATFALWNY
jgi:riboflavin biosynthesis pyrimidine reductase